MSDPIDRINEILRSNIKDENSFRLELQIPVFELSSNRELTEKFVSKLWENHRYSHREYRVLEITSEYVLIYSKITNKYHKFGFILDIDRFGWKVFYNYDKEKAPR